MITRITDTPKLEYFRMNGLYRIRIPPLIILNGEQIWPEQPSPGFWRKRDSSGIEV